MATLTDLLAQRDTLIRRLTSLRTRVDLGDRSHEYDLRAAESALRVLDNEIAKARTAQSGQRGTRVVRLTMRSGF